MKASWKRFLSMLLAAAMVLSFGGTGYAADLDEDIVLVDPEEETADVQLVDEIQAAAEGKVWVGGVEITEDNASDVLGDGKVSYDFESNTLSFTASPKFSGVHEGALIYASTETPLTINMPAKSFYFMYDDAEVCIYTESGLIVNGDLKTDLYDVDGSFGVKSMNGPVTITGVADITANETGIYCGNGDVTIGGAGYFICNSEAELGFCPSSCIYAANGGVDLQSFVLAFGVASNAIYANGPIHIRSDLDLDNSGGLGGGEGLRSTAGGIVIDGFAKINLRGGVCLDAGQAPEGITVKGYADLTNTGDINVLKALGGPIFIDGYLKVNGRGDCVVQAKGDITVNGYAYISASRYNSSDPASAMRSTDGSISIAGSLTTYSSDSPVYARNDITVGGDTLLSFARATESRTVEFGLKAETGSIRVNGKLEVLGKADASVFAGTDITVEKDVTITNAAEDAVGMLAGGSISFVEGKWDVSAGAAALRAKDGIEIPEGFCVTTPVCGVVSKVGDFVTVTELNGTTVAAHAVIEAGEHEWNEPSYVWAEDNSSVTATRVCKNNAEHTETETAETTAVTKDPGCEENGETTYTATFDNPAFESQTKTVVIPATGHEWGEPVWSWTGVETAEATFTCTNDASHTETVKAVISSERVEPSCEEAGSVTYTASVSFNGKSYTDVKTETLEALGHTPGEAVRENEVAATCETDGSYDEVVYCTVCHKELSRETKTVPALGHEWAEKTYEWAEDNSVCTARTHCLRDDSHVLDISVKTTYEVITAPTTETEGLGRYTAVFEAPFETQTKDVVIEKLPADGFKITIEDMKTNAAVEGIDEEGLYSGTVTFTVSSTDDQAVLVAVKRTAAEDDSFELVKPATDEEGKHSFTIEVTEDTTIALAFRGDANLNGRLETRDATLICQVKNGAYSNRGNLSVFAADVNNNGRVETRDATLLAQARNNNYTISW